MKRILSLIVISLLFASCSVFRDTQKEEAEMDTQSMFGVEWKLKKIGNKLMKYDEESMMKSLK